MNMFEKADLIEKQMENAKVVLFYKHGHMGITCENASPATYGFIISEMLDNIAEKYPKMTSVIQCVCNIFLESHGSEVK